MNRRTFLTASLGMLAAGAARLPAGAAERPKSWAGAEGPAVYLTKDISPAGLRRAFDALGARLPGKVGVKVSTGEPGGHNFLSPALVKDLVQGLRANIVECNTAYGGRRGNLRDHIRAALEHGWCDIATVDIQDGVATMDLPAPEGARHLKKDIVGANFRDYGSYLVLSHFKGHAMGGFGGALKNLSIGFASRAGKMYIHTAGKSERTWMGGEQVAFLESMAEAATAVCRARPGAMAFVNVMNRLSVDCDCDSHPSEPTMRDIGILASLDPVALDQACVDLVYAAPDGADLIERMESRQGIHTVEHAAALGLGSRAYRLVELV